MIWAQDRADYERWGPCPAFAAAWAEGQGAPREAWSALEDAVAYALGAE